VQQIIEKIKREPVIVIDVIKAILVLLVSFGVSIDPNQQSSVIGFVIALIAIFGVGAVAQRQLVTPTAAPQVPSGTLVAVTHGNGTNTSTVAK